MSFLSCVVPHAESLSAPVPPAAPSLPQNDTPAGKAARAGQHGRGFAVVAQEVRNLAARSAKAARETSDLIESAGTRVLAGVKIADETSRAFTSIAEDIGKVRNFMHEIAVASNEQARGVAQINTAMGEVAKTALATSQQAEEVAELVHFLMRPGESGESDAGQEESAVEASADKLGEGGQC